MGWGLTSKQKVTLVILILGAFVTVLNQTVVTPALPPIMAEMGIDAATLYSCKCNHDPYNGLFN